MLNWVVENRTFVMEYEFWCPSH